MIRDPKPRNPKTKTKTSNPKPRAPNPAKTQKANKGEEPRACSREAHRVNRPVTSRGLLSAAGVCPGD